MTILDLPKSSKVDKFIPKKTFTQKIANAKALFSNIEKITWAYKLSPKTINIPKSAEVEEIHIFDIILKSKDIPKKALSEIKKLIPYPILFRLTYDAKFCYALEHEEKHYFSEFDEVIVFNFSDTNLQKVYQNIVKKFLKNIVDKTSTMDFKKTVELNSKIEMLKKEIKALENKLKKRNSLTNS